MAYIDLELAKCMGLVRVGGDLSPASLSQAYRTGMFPWFDEGDPIFWWSPDPRAILEMDGLYISRRLARTLRSGKFQITLDRAFGDVMRGCAVRDERTWITDEMLEAYEEMHRLGYAHSVEAWQDRELVGGIYGIALGGFFAGESMFSRVSDASKVAWAALMDHLRNRGFELFDCQFINDHTKRMGVTEITRKEYFRRLRSALKIRTKF